MIKLTKFYTKVFVKTPIFILFLLFNMYILIFQLNALNSSILEYISVICFAIIASNLFFLVSTSSITSKKSEIMEFLEANEFKRYLVIILSGLIISVATSIIPIIMILVFKNSSIEPFFVFKGILNFFIIWNLSNMVSILIGASIGVLLKRWISILISLVIYSFFPFYLFNPLFESKVLSKFLNIYSDSTTIQENILCDEIFNMSYFFDKAFIMCLILLMIILVKILLDENKKILFSIIFISIVLLMGITIFVGSNSVTYIHKYDNSQLSDINYHIKSYEMDLNIENKLKNSVSFQLDMDNNIEPITLLLDNLFKIEEIKIDNEPVNFIHEDDKIVLEYKANEKKSINISISYEGYIHIENNLGVDTFYCSNDALNLTNCLHWYPSLYDNSPINYNINLNTSSKIYSNLDIVSQSNNLLSNEYKLNGIAPEVDLFAGQYKSVVDSGVEYIIPSTYDDKTFKQKLEEDISSNLERYNKKLSQEDFNTLKYKKYKKVIIGMKVNTNTNIKLSNNVLLISYN